MKYEMDLIRAVGSPEIITPEMREELGIIEVIYEDSIQQTALVAIKDKVVYVAFQGSEKPKQWIADFIEFPLKTEKMGKEKFHQGFYDYYKVMEPLVHNVLIAQLGKWNSITVIGHSLGAAIAGIYAYHENVQRIVTIGQPKFANKFVTDWINNFCTVECYLNGDDIIRSVAPFLKRNKSVDIGKKHCWIDKGSVNDHMIWSYEKSLKEYLGDKY
jgi:hypothetical protein